MNDEDVLDEIQASRFAASRYEQLGMREIARLLWEHARAGERWIAAPNEAARRRIRVTVSAPLVIRHALLFAECLN